MAEPTNLENWKTSSEIVKNIAQVIVFAGGVFALLKWLYERRDRATEVLLSLDEKFSAERLSTRRNRIKPIMRWHRYSLPFDHPECR